MNYFLNKKFFIVFLFNIISFVLFSQQNNHIKQAQSAVTNNSVISIEKAAKPYQGKYRKKVDHTNTSWYLEMKKETPNLIQAEEKFRAYFIAHPRETSKQRKEFIRWITVNKTNVNEQGFVIKNTIEKYSTLMGSKNTLEGQHKSVASSSWRMIGPNNHLKTRCDGESSWMSGGYVDRVYINPYNTQNLFAGFSFGGLWVSQNQGDTWTLTDGEFPNGTNTYANNDRYYGEIEACQASPSTVYAATEAGLLKSTNSGADWNYCATLNRTVDINNRPYYIAVSPNNPNMVTSTFGRKVYHSNNGGNSWTLAFDNTNGGTNLNGTNQHVVSDFGLYERTYNFFGLEINYNNPNIVFLGVRNSNNEPCIYKSTNGGASFNFLINLNITNNRTMPTHVELHSIGGSPNKFFVTPRFTYIDGIEEDKKYSYDLNGNLLQVSDFATQAEAVCMDWENENVIYNGKYFGEHLFKSTNGGPTFTDMVSINPNFCKSIHADLRDISAIGNLVLMATDGGMSISKDGGISIQTTGHEISAVDLWGFGSSLRSDICVASLDHGPSSVRAFVGDGGWIDRGGADALHATVSQSHDRWVYYNRNYGGRFKEYVNPDGTLSNQTTVAPPFNLEYIEFHPNIYTIIYGYDDKTLYRTIDNFESDTGYETIYTFSKNIKQFKIAKDDPNVIYVLLSNNEIRKSTNSGATWNNVTPNIGTNFLGLTLGETPDDVFISLGNANTSVKVIKSTNGGNTWQDWTTSNLPTNATAAITHQIGTDGGVYLAYPGMQGVWYRNNTMNQWEELGNGLPMLGYITDDDIYSVPNKGVCRIGTSRGAWEHDLFEASDLVADFSVKTNKITCSNQILEFIDNSSATPGNLSYNWSFEGATPASSNAQTPEVYYTTPGTYDVTLIISDQNGNSSTRTLTDFITVTNDCNDGVLSPYEAYYTCNGNNIPQSSFISTGQEILVKDFSNESGSEFFVNLNILTNCDNKTANLQALIDVDFNKITVAKYLHFNDTINGPIRGDRTAKVTSFKSTFAEIAFEIRDKKLYFTQVQNPCVLGGVAKIEPSCWSDACSNSIAATNFILGGQELEIVDFPDADSIIYVSLNSFVNCYNKTSKLLAVIDIPQQTIKVIDYFHFNSETNAPISGNGTNVVTSVSSDYGRISYRIVGTKLYYKLISNACGSVGKSEISCWKALNDCVDINLNALLEGTYDNNTNQMTTGLHTRGLLPGQIPNSNLATPTPAGQPYSIAPWNYAGTEGAGWTDTDYSGNEIDWVLVSFRTGEAKSTEVGMTAGLLMKDGRIDFPNRCALTSTVASPLYIVIEHRNHIGVMTPQPIDVINSTLSYDFRLSDSYRDAASFGQKQLPTGEWTMYSGDADQTDFPSFDIKGTDKTLWFQNNGVFDYYLSPDFNLDGDINGQDKSLWFENNGISSRVPK